MLTDLEIDKTGNLNSIRHPALHNCSKFLIWLVQLPLREKSRDRVMAAI